MKQDLKLITLPRNPLSANVQFFEFFEALGTNTHTQAMSQTIVGRDHE